MLTVDHYASIRRAHRDGLTIRAIARTLHLSRRKVREAIENPEPRPYTRLTARAAPVLDSFKPLIDQILADDQQAPRKQRHSAAQLFRRLQQEQGYPGSYDSVRRYVAGQRRRSRETFIPLVHDPGQRAEADFGHLQVDFPEGRRRVDVLLVTWAYSYCPFAIALPTERTEAILQGLVSAWEFFGCVPKELWWDNPTTVAVQILKGRQRKLNESYAALASHYNFEPLFCMPARGNEKPHVENRVKCLQQHWGTPVPQAADLASFNAYLRQCCLSDLGRTVEGKPDSIGERFERDRASALALPPRAFDACLTTPAQVDKYQTVRFDTNTYSVPRSFAFQTVSIKAYVDRIDVVAGSEVIAHHVRSYERSRQVLDPLHYLATLSRKPACLDQTDVFRRWELPTIFEQLRAALEARHGPHTGARQYTRVLQLLAAHPQQRVEQAIQACRALDDPQADRILRCAERLAARQVPPPEELADQTAAVRQLQVPLPDLRCFDQLLSLGDQDDVCPSNVAEDQPQTVATAEHVCGV